MKYMVSCRQSVSYLKNAKEIRVDYKDKAILSYLIEDDWSSTADINIYVPRDQEIKWEYFDRYKELLNLIFVVENTYSIPEVRNKGYKVFWAYPVSTYWELNSLTAAGVDEVLLDAPLFFDLANVKNLIGDIEIRLNPIVCFHNYMPQETGICGTYVRPEDVDKYAEFVDHMEFGVQPLKKERLLVEIYDVRKHWPGNLELLLTNLNFSIDNRGFEGEPFAERRMSCKQKCQSGGVCHYCDLIFKYITYLDKNKEELAQTYDIDLTPEKPERTIEEIKQHIDEMTPLIENENEQLEAE